MKSSMKNKVGGMFIELKGKLKEVVGKITDNPKLETEGKVETISGKLQVKSGQFKRFFGK